jgi:hypothetical protein
MIRIDIILGSECVSPWREDMNCRLGALVLMAPKSVLASRGIVLGIMTWSIDVKVQLDDGGENK